MNEFERDAIVAHYDAQEARAVAYAAAMKDRPTCKLSAPQGGVLPAGFLFECNGNVGEMPKIEKWEQPRTPGVILAEGGKQALGQLPIATVAGAGMFFLNQLGQKGIESAQANSSTVTISGKNNTNGNVSSAASINGNGNYTGGQVSIPTKTTTTTKTITTDDHTTTTSGVTP